MSTTGSGAARALPQSRLAVVTGAASGMGRSAAQRFVEEGWEVLAMDVAPVGLDGVTETMVDIRDRAAVEDAVRDLVAEHSRPGIGALLNIAGVYPPTTIETFDEDTYRRIFDINVLGTANVAAACLPHMGEGSAIVNFSSVDAFTVSPGQLLYGASKAAVVMLTKGLALELAPRGIRVNAIAPGWVATPGNAATGRMSAAAASIPLGRVAQPEEIADWCWQLTGGGMTSFMTGETVVLSGGDVLR